MGADHLLRDLDASQRRAVTSPARPLGILAPAGSGKTRVLTRRIAWRVATDDADPAHVLALTFTRKAAGELRDRLRALGLRDAVAAGTFHALAYAQLRTWWADQGRRPPALLPRKVRLLGEVMRNAPGGSLTPAQLAGEIEWAKARLLGPHDYAEAARLARRRTPGSTQRIADLYARYEDAKRRERLVDFDDLLRLCTHLIETEPAFADAQRWRFRHLFVDEVQDVNPLQVRLLEAWRGQRYDLCVVGDPCQAIYGWNGADADFLRGFAARYPTAEVVTLEHNYRSTPQVLTAAADVLRAARASGDPVRAVRSDGPPPRLERHRTDRDEARAIARAVRDRHGPGASWSSQAVLARTNAQLPLVAEALRDAGVPHRVRGGDDLLGRSEIRRALDLLRQGDGLLSARLPDLAALAERYGADGDVDGGPEAGSSVAGSAGAGSAGAGSAGAGSDGEAQGSLELLVRLAHDQLDLDRQITAAGFVAWLAATFEAEAPDPGSDAVTLATFHAAKGLEWPVVHLAGLEDGFVPISHARTPADRAEEARLLYVAMTRAEEELRCTWAAGRTFGQQVVERELCPWLAGLAERQRDRAATPPRPDGWQQRLAEERARLAAAVATPSSATPSATAAARSGLVRLPELAALRVWRDEAARVARIEPQTLVNDAVLEAIAAARPSTVDELAAVSGMGPLLVARVGDALLAALAAVDVDDPARR